jgi:hypothetical protein
VSGVALQFRPDEVPNMRSRVLTSLAVIAVVLAVCGVTFAHHGSSAYSDKLVTLKDATVTKFVWANPHSILYFDVKGKDGKVTHWAAEAGSPSALGLIGWDKNSFRPGDVVTVNMYQAKTGNPVGRLSRVVLADGTMLGDSQQGGETFNGLGAQPPKQ